MQVPKNIVRPTRKFASQFSVPRRLRGIRRTTRSRAGQGFADDSDLSRVGDPLAVDNAIERLPLHAVIVDPSENIDPGRHPAVEGDARELHDPAVAVAVEVPVRKPARCVKEPRLQPLGERVVADALRPRAGCVAGHVNREVAMQVVARLVPAAGEMIVGGRALLFHSPTSHSSWLIHARGASVKPDGIIDFAEARR